MPWRELMHTPGGKFDYALASLLTSGSGFLLFIETTTPILAWLGLLVGLAVAVQRFARNWKHWDKPPGTK